MSARHFSRLGQRAVGAIALALCFDAAGATPPSEALPEAPAADENERAVVVVVVFVEGMGPAPEGLVLTADDGAVAQTSVDGVARLTVSPGTRSVMLTIPANTLPGQTEERGAPVAKVLLDGGGSAQLLLNLDAAGAIMGVDVEGKSVSEESEAEPEVEAEPVEVVTGTITGHVVSSEDGSPVVDVLVIVPGVETEVRTDTDGRFSIEVPSGTQAVSVVHTRFSTETKSDVVVPEQGSVDVEFELTPATSQLDDVVITAPHVKGGVADVMSKRRKSTSVQDELGSADIAKTGDGSASSASRRIVGASVVGGQFLLVRGLGGRYSNVRLNGVPLPSTDPDLPGFQLDLFPTSLLSSLTITKTFSPDIPGDFAGGSMNITTKDFPEKFTLTLSVGTSYNTQTTGQQVLRSGGSDTDFLGFDDGSRALPDGVPPERLSAVRVRRGQEPPEGALLQGDVDEIAADFPNNWAIRRKLAYPNFSLGASLGNTYDLGSAGKLGYLFTGGYKYDYSHYDEKITNVSLSGMEGEEELTVREELNREVGQVEALLGGLGTISYAPVENHQFSLVSLITQNGVDTTSFATGLSEEEGVQVQSTQLRWVERQLRFNQFLAKHQNLGDLLTIEWQLNTAQVERDQPDSKTIFYQQNPGGDFAFRSVAGSGERLYSELYQTDYGGGLDLIIAFMEDGKGKLGYMGRRSERAFQARRFAPNYEGSDMTGRAQAPEDLFSPDNIPERWTLAESSQVTDAFDSEAKLDAAYGMLELPVLSWFQAVGGLRVEHYRQSLTAGPPYAVEEEQDAEAADEEDAEEEPTGGSSDDFDYLPAAGLIFRLSEQTNVRAAYGGTVARPQVKEVAPFRTNDYVRRRETLGNPDLKRSFVHNFDLRVEFFPNPTEVFALSAFYKTFEDPIESVILDQNGSITFENIEGADNYGVEFEARVGLGVLDERIEDFGVLANLALIQSEVRLSEEQQRIATSATRPLAGQSPYVANLGLGWEPEVEVIPFSAFAFYNVFGRRISDTGRSGLPDIYEEAFHSVDANVNWVPLEEINVSVSGSNLLFQRQRFTQGGLNSVSSNRGATFGISAGYRY